MSDPTARAIDRDPVAQARLAVPAHGHHPALAHHFDNLEQQKEAGTLGMWVFLVTEILFFGGIFMVYLVYRTWYSSEFGVASEELDIFWGTLNTAVLIGSSLTMALAVHAAQLGSRRATAMFIVLTMILGAVFLGVKALEYSHKFHEHLVPGVSFDLARFKELKHPQAAEIFFSLYFVMTGLHALHMVIGLGIMAVLAWLAWRGSFSPEYHAPVEIGGLYWHFVDIVWIFLFPLLYLINRHLH
jgi:cytochrome c oxidase subunit 3